MFQKYAAILLCTICVGFLAVNIVRGQDAVLVGVGSDLNSVEEIDHLKKTLAACGFPQERISVLISNSSSAPTLENLKRKFNQLATLGKEDLLFIALLGPCCTINQELYFSPEGADESRSSLLLVSEQIEKLRTERIVLLVDATFTPTGSNRLVCSAENVRPDRFPENTVLFFNDLHDYPGQSRPEKSLIRYFADQLQETEYNADLDDDKKIDIAELLRFFEIHPERLYYKAFRTGKTFENFVFAQRTAVSIEIVPHKQEFYREIAQIQDSDSPVVSLVFDARLSQKPLLWTASGKSVRIYQSFDGKPIEAKRFSEPISSIALNGKSGHLLVATEDMNVELFEMNYGLGNRNIALNSIREYDEMKKLHSSRRGTVRVEFDPTSERFLAASALSVCLWDGFGESALCRTIDPKLRSAGLDTAAACFIPGKERVLTAFVNSPITLWNLEKSGENKILREYRHFGTIYDLALSPDGKTFVSVSSNNKALVWNLDSDSAQRQFSGHKDDVTTVTFSPNGERVLTTSLDGTAILWDAQSNEEVQTFDLVFQGTPHQIRTAAFSPDARHLAFGLSNGKIVVCERMEK